MSSYFAHMLKSSLDQVTKRLREKKVFFGPARDLIFDMHIGVTYQNKYAKDCHRCGSTGHVANNCFFKDKKCFKCKEIGHTKERCPTKGINFEDIVDEDENDLEEGMYALNLYNFTVEIL